MWIPILTAILGLLSALHSENNGKYAKKGELH